MDKFWTAEDEAKLTEALARKAAAKRAEADAFDVALFDNLEWGYEQGFDREGLMQAMIESADEICELLMPYRKEATNG